MLYPGWDSGTTTIIKDIRGKKLRKYEESMDFIL